MRPRKTPVEQGPSAVPITYIRAESPVYQDTLAQERLEELREKKDEQSKFEEQVALKRKKTIEKRIQAQATKKKEGGITQKSRDISQLYENQEFLVVRPVQVERLPQDLLGATNSRVSSVVEVEQGVIDHKADVMALRERNREREEQSAKFEDERRVLEKIKKEKWLKKNPDHAKNLKRTEQSDEEPMPPPFTSQSTIEED